MFVEPEGATPLDPNEIEGLKFKHITTRGELDELEQANITQGLRWLARRRNGGVLTDEFVRTLHKRIFGEVSCPDNTRVAARTGWGGSRSAGMAISGACSCMVREACCAGAAPSRARGLAGPTGSWRGGRQTSCWSPWPIRQPASPGHCSDTSVSTDRRPPDQLESGYKLAMVTTI